MNSEIKKLLEDVKKDEALAKELAACKTPEAMVELLNKKNYKVTAADFDEAMKADSKVAKELSVEDMEKVAGGGSWISSELDSWYDYLKWVLCKADDGTDKLSDLAMEGVEWLEEKFK